MKSDQTISIGIILLSILALFVSPGLAATDAESVTTTHQIAVTDVVLDPPVMMRGDTGTVTITVQNTGTQTVTIKAADFSAKELTTLNYRTYQTSLNLGPGDKTDFTFTIQAHGDGIYYPKFYLDLGTESFRYYVPIKVESTLLDIAILERPGSFMAGVKDTITLVIGNPRENTLSGVTVTPQGSGVETTQTKIFIGDLAPGKSTEVGVDLTPLREGGLSFIVDYRNGINKHNASITIPVEFGEDKRAARPLINNIELSASGSTYTLSADVTNAGLTDANSIVITVGDPARGIDPNPLYVVGTLEPDDFSSFEITFTVPPGASTLPVIIQYKDADGNNFQNTSVVTLRESSGSNRTGISSSGGSYPSPERAGPGGQTRGGGVLFGGMGSGFAQIPFVPISIVLISCVALILAWRKGYLGRIRARLRR